MWTILWTEEDGTDRWERCENKEEVVTLIATLSNTGIDDSDIFIITPEADDYVISTSDL